MVNEIRFRNIPRAIPGILFLFFAGLLGWFVGEQIPHVSYLLICIAIGIFVSNVTDLPDLVEEGINKTHKIWLEAGIMVLGARIILADLLEVGPLLLTLVLIFLLISLLLVQFLSSKFNLEEKLGSCLASGLSVCGVSAIVATGGGIQTKAKHIAYAIAVVLAFDVITVFAYPAIGGIFSIPDRIFGAWAGVSMFSTGTTVAAAFSHSAVAGETATIAKMARNVFIGIWSLAFVIYYTRKGEASQIDSKAIYLWNKFPKFVLGFLFTMILANIGFFTNLQLNYMENAYSWLFMMAFVGLGYNINFSDMKKIGLKPLIVAVIAFLIVSPLSLLLSYLLLG